jgi:antibiotic biosynthesis monooxygenase (ABM) superfamily enzyme
MYGTVARLRLKPEAAGQLEQQLKEFEGLSVPGYVSTTIYRMDANSNEYYMAVVFDSRESYVANAEDPEQHQRYLQMRELLESDPEWHDGEVVYAET